MLPLSIPDSCKFLNFVPEEPPPLSDHGQALLEAVEAPVAFVSYGRYTVLR